MADLANLLARIRTESGNPKTDEVTDASIAQFVTDGLVYLNRWCPAWSIETLTTVANQQTYSVATGVFEAAFVDYRGDSTVSDIFGVDFNVILPGGDYLNSNLTYDVETDIYRQVIDALTRQKVRGQFDWEWNEFDKKIYLIPPPTVSGNKVYYVGLRPWTMATIPARFEILVVKYAVVETLLQKARRGRRETAISHTGSISPWSLADPTIMDARKLKEELDNTLLIESRKLAVFWGGNI